MSTVRTAPEFATVEARARHVARGVAETHPIFVARAEGARVWDTAGREYLDFIGGIGVLNTGHRHPRIDEHQQRRHAGHGPVERHSRQQDHEWEWWRHSYREGHHRRRTVFDARGHHRRRQYR